MRLFYGLFALCAVGFSVADTYAAPPIFGPKKYIRTTGQPTVVTDTFRSCNSDALYVMRVENGEGGAGMISSAVITINNKEIVVPSDFNQETAMKERSVTLG